MRVPFDRSNAHVYARALIDFAERASTQSPHVTVSLPRFRLLAASNSSHFVEMCRRALVDDPVYADDQAPLTIGTYDYESRPDMPRGIWADAMFGLSVVADGLRPAGFEGLFDFEYKRWQFYDPATRRGVEALAAPGGYPPWTESFPIRNLMHWAYQAIGWRIVHGGTLGIDGKGVMVIGPGGSGKSGTTLAGILAGMQSVGDDYVAVDPGEGKLVAYPVMRLVKQDPAGLKRLGLDPAALGLSETNWQNKYEFDFEALGAGRRAKWIELQAILLPRIANAERSSFSRAPAHAAMMGLAPNNLSQLPDGWREGLSFTASMARRIPGYYLDLGTDKNEIADSVGEFIAGKRP